MVRCVGCGSEDGSRWFFLRTPRGVITACSSTCRDVYLRQRARSKADEEDAAEAETPLSSGRKTARD